MNYYCLENNAIREGIIQLNNIPTSYADIQRNEGLKGYLTTLFPENLTDYIEKPYPIVSNEFFKVIQIYQERVKHKLVTIEEKQGTGQHIYWALQPESIDCLHPETKIDDRNKIERLVLKGISINYHHFFSVDGLKEGEWIVSLELMESLLRRGLNGFKGKRVEVI